MSLMDPLGGSTVICFFCRLNIVNQSWRFLTAGDDDDFPANAAEGCDNASRTKFGRFKVGESKVTSFWGEKAAIESFRGDTEATAVDPCFLGEMSILTFEQEGKAKFFEVLDGGGLLEEIRMEANWFSTFLSFSSTSNIRLLTDFLSLWDIDEGMVDKVDL